MGDCYNPFRLERFIETGTPLSPLSDFRSRFLTFTLPKIGSGMKLRFIRVNS